MGLSAEGSLGSRTRAFGKLACVVAVLGAAAATPAAPALAQTTTSDSADRMIFWLDCDRIATLTDAQLDAWKSRGVDGFVCQVGHLRHIGGTQDFTGDPGATLSGSNYELQRQLRNSDIVGRARARGMRMYLGTYLVNYWNRKTPLCEWFDDECWSETVLPEMRDLAAAARLLGFEGLAVDQELYAQTGGVEDAVWDWDYPGNTHSEAEVRAAAKDRGRQLMQAIVDRFPGVEIVAYDVQFPSTWEAVVQNYVNDDEDFSATRLDLDFWDGLTSVEGYDALRLIDAIFYKAPHVGSWDNALRYNANTLASLLSKRFSNWDYASSRLYLSPFSWIDPGPSSSSFDDARSPSHVRDQLLAFRKWGMGGEFANYVWDDHLFTFDFSPYVNAMQEASSPAPVDQQRPTLEVLKRLGKKSGGRIEGVAADNLAVWAVRWRDDRGGSGVAKLDWEILSGGPKEGYSGQTRWSIDPDDFDLAARRVTLVAEDIKGRESEPLSFTPADKRAPQTRITSSPKRRAGRTVRFRFDADEPGARFECKLDRRGWKPCNGGHARYHVKRGRHQFRVRAIDHAGNVDPTPAKARFRVRRR